MTADRETALLQATAAVPTPALVVDLAAADRNIARADAYFAGRATRLRPHFKAHKCTTLMRRQLASGAAAGVTCATAWEAEVLARAGGFDDVLVANEVADRAALVSLAHAARATRVTACVDAPAHVHLLAEVAADHDVTFGVLVEVDVGQHRAGVEPGSDDLVTLARLVTETPRLELRGLQGYEGHAVLLRERARRAEQVNAAAGILAAERARLEQAGLPCELVSGGGTGTFDLSTEAGALDEIQAGSYVLMDARYGEVDGPFEQALFCRTTVVSRRGDRAVLDAGLKALSAEYGMPAAVRPGVTVTSLADEHATATLTTEAGGLAVGDQMLLVPAHVDPTVNLHAALHVVAPDGSVAAWPVDARRP